MEAYLSIFCILFYKAILYLCNFDHLWLLTFMFFSVCSHSTNLWNTAFCFFEEFLQIWTNSGHSPRKINFNYQNSPVFSKLKLWSLVSLEKGSAAGWCHCFTAGEETPFIISVVCFNMSEAPRHSNAHFLKELCTSWCLMRWHQRRHWSHRFGPRHFRF